MAGIDKQEAPAFCLGEGLQEVRPRNDAVLNPALVGKSGIARQKVIVALSVVAMTGKEYDHGVVGTGLAQKLKRPCDIGAARGKAPACATDEQAAFDVLVLWSKPPTNFGFKTLCIGGGKFQVRDQSAAGHVVINANRNDV